MQRTTTFLWFDDQAEEAANHYVEIFRAMGHEDSGITTTSRYGKAGSNAAGRPVGSVMTVVFTLAGQEYIALNGGPEFRFNEAVSLVVNCDTQEEIDGFWERLSAGGEEGPCGWLKDQLRALVAGGAGRAGALDRRRRPGAFRPRDGGRAGDEEARPGRAPAGVRGLNTREGATGWRT